MKKFLIFTVITLLSIGLAFSQEIELLKLTPNGVKPIVVEVEGMSASEMYKNSIRWVQETFKNPDEVLKANIENEKIRIDGFAFNAWWFKSLGTKLSLDMEYTVSIDFKDGRYRFEFNVGQFWGDGQKVLYDYTLFFNKKGEVKNTYEDAVPSLELTMNALSFSFYNYVTGKTKEKNDDW